MRNDEIKQVYRHQFHEIPYVLAANRNGECLVSDFTLVENDLKHLNP